MSLDYDFAIAVDSHRRVAPRLSPTGVVHATFSGRRRVGELGDTHTKKGQKHAGCGPVNIQHRN